MGYRNGSFEYNRHTNPKSDYKLRCEMIFGWAVMALACAGLTALFVIFDKKDTSTANKEDKKTEQVVPPQLQDSTKMARTIAYDRMARQK